jgi:ribosomal protein S27E
VSDADDDAARESTVVVRVMMNDDRGRFLRIRCYEYKNDHAPSTKT